MFPVIRIFTHPPLIQFRANRITYKTGKRQTTGESRGYRIQDMERPFVTFEYEVHFQLPVPGVE